ncbi:MAG: glycosyltransferase family 2 protein, partial [Flavobacterium sp.]
MSHSETKQKGYPLVSVLMTAFNREEFIAEAMESVLNSSYSNFELIIVDDASSDKTFKIATQIAGDDSRVKVFRNEVNLGDYPNRNRAASYACGKWLFFVDSDDTIFPDGIKKCIDLMSEYPNSSLGMRVFNNAPKPYSLSPDTIFREHFFHHPILTIGPGGTIISRDFFNTINCYPVKYGPANDMYFNLKAATKTEVVFIPFEFQFYRRHDGQEINNSFSYLFNSYLYLKDALKDLSIPLTSKELDWISKKNKRRFVTN